MLTSSARADTAPTLGIPTPEALEKILKDAGYETSPLGEGAYRIQFGESDGWKFDMTVRHSPDNVRMFIFVRLQNLPALDKLPPKAVMDVLVANSQFNPPFFMLMDRKTSSELWMTHHFDNTAENAAKVKDQINVVCRGLRKSAELWSAAKWGLTPPATTAPSTQPAGG